MKKLLILTGIICVLFCISAHAANGDIAGNIYSTDIRAFINGVEVPSYNIGGRTAVVIEDITEVSQYNDELRVLLIKASYSLSPEYLIGGKSDGAAVSGNIIGNIYETDIETYLYDKELPSYNIGGKTAVAIEDLGGFKEYNEFGGRYFYDDDTRTITLETIYDNSTDKLNIMFNHQSDVTLSLNEDKTKVYAEFQGDAYTVGGNEKLSGELDNVWQKNQPMLLPVVTAINGEEKKLGYFFGHNEKDVEHIGIEMNGELLTSGYAVDEEKDDFKDVYELTDAYTIFTCLNEDVMEEGASTVIIQELTKREQVIRDWLWHHWNGVKDRIDTDDYSFLYAGWFGGPHGGSYENLLRIDNDGAYHDYASEFESVSYWGQKSFDNVRIDKENEKCYFRYDEDYVIDLKTCQLTYADGRKYSRYPSLPETDRKHYVIYKEGYRDFRVELAVFDTDADRIEWKNDNDNGNPLYPNGKYENEIKYYLDGDKWVEFERGYERISNNAVNVMESSLDVINTNKRYITCFGKRR